MKGIGKLHGVVKHYDWGGKDFIPSLLAIDNHAGKPFAEYWLGLHSLADCKVEFEGEQPILLKNFIENNPGSVLGDEVVRDYGTLPYLLKILDVSEMLSIQVHPSKDIAGREFARENAEGIPVDSIKRNYKDANHKPELMTALGEFWLLHGFKSEKKLLETLESNGELSDLIEIFQKKTYEALYRYVMEMPQKEVNRTLAPLLDRVLPLYNEGKLKKDDENFWAARAARSFLKTNDIDRGIFSIYLFNLVQLKKGEAVYQPAGLPHAYLEGKNVEIMANSDNVLRGGLTTKHIDVPELLRNVKFEATEVDIIEGDKEGHGRIYKTDAPDFELSGYYMQQGEEARFRSVTAEVLLLTEGEVDISSGNEVITVQRGSIAAFVLPGREIHLKAKSVSTVYRATIPIHRSE